MTSPVVPAIAAAVLLAGCAPALDWRDARPAGSGAVLLFPCRPVGQERNVALGKQTVRLALHACSAGGQTWGLAFADVAEPALVGPALAQLREAAAANIGATGAQALALQVAGATPHPASARDHLHGHLPDGGAVLMQVAVFAHGTQVFQATALGERLPDDAAEIFFAAIRFSP